MHPKAPIYAVFLLSTLVSCTVYVDDQDGSPSLLWGGSWGRYSDLGSAYTELAWQGTLSLGNQSGGTVTFTFTGTSVGVFGSLWPGESEAARSMYVIDNGQPTEFIPPGLQTPSRLQFYASGTLPEGEHTLKVTNLGAFLWLDYFEFDDVVVSSSASSTSTITSSPTATATRPFSTTTTSPETSISTSPSPSSTHENNGGPISSITPSFTATSSQLSTVTSGPGTSPTVSLSSSSSVPAAPPPLNPIPSSSSSSSTSTASGTSSSPNVPPPPQDAATPQVQAHGLSRSARVGIIAATAAGGVALLALVLLCFWRRHLRRTRSRLRGEALPSFQKPASSSSEGGSCSTNNGHVSPCSTATPSPTTASAPPTARPASGDGIGSESCACGHQVVGPRARDGGVSVAGGPGLSNGVAPSIFEVEGEKNMLPPSYQDSAADLRYAHGQARA